MNGYRPIKRSIEENIGRIITRKWFYITIVILTQIIALGLMFLLLWKISVVTWVKANISNLSDDRIFLEVNYSDAIHNGDIVKIKLTKSAKMASLLWYPRTKVQRIRQTSKEKMVLELELTDQLANILGENKEAGDIYIGIPSSSIVNRLKIREFLPIWKNK